MLELKDFSALLQVVIAFYGVYAIANKGILNTFIFSFIYDSLEKLRDKSDLQLQKAKEKYESIQRDESEIDKNKLSEAQVNLMATCMMGAKQEYDLANSLNNSFKLLVNQYEGESFFPVISVDMLILCVTLMVLGVLDHKTVWIVDEICMTLILFVALLQFHCYLYEFSSKIRAITSLTPTILNHILLLTVVLIGAFFFFYNNDVQLEEFKEITRYMSLFAFCAAAPPIIILGRHYMMYNRLNGVLKHTDKSIKWSMQWYHRDVANYKEMYHFDV